MCDYSLYAVRQRLAVEGDDLVTYRFETGSIGFAAVSEVQREVVGSHVQPGVWGRFVNWLRLGSTCNVTAVCMPPGARVELRAGDMIAKDDIGLAPVSEAIFDQISAEPFMYRDALRLPDGHLLTMQSLPEGIRARVLSLGSNAEALDQAVLLHLREEERLPARRG